MTAQDSSLLEYDFNETTERQLCEVFRVTPYHARCLKEYQQEVLHVFKLEQLHKLKGTPDNFLQEWAKPVSGRYSADFQKMLGLASDQAEPMGKIFEAVCQKTQSSAVWLGARNGEKKMVSAKPPPELEKLISSVAEVIKVVQDDMVNMKVGCSQLHAVQFETGQLFYLTAGAYDLVAIRSGEFSMEMLGIWEKMADEIRLRDPPVMKIENHAKVTENDIAFDCPGCQLRIVVDQSAAGGEFPCPRCKQEVQVPMETTSFSSYVSESVKER